MATFDMVAVGCGEWCSSGVLVRSARDVGLTCDAKGVAREKIIYPCEYLVLQTTAVANLRVADSYLFKTGDAKWEDGIVALEGGTCSVSLTRRHRTHSRSPQLQARDSAP